MTHALKAYRNQDEDGFTLIELLVVVIIIGILAAIAIPAFLNQRERAWQAELTSTVRNVALEVEAEATQVGGIYVGANGAFTAIGDLTNFITTEVTELQGNATTPVTLTATQGSLTAFQICGTHLQITGANSVVYDSDGQNGSGNGAAIVGTGIQNFDESACGAEGSVAS